MQNTVVIGSRQNVLGFRSVGFGILEADTAEQAREQLAKAVNGGCSIIFITEDYCEALAEQTAKYRSRPLPAIIPIPPASGATGYGMNLIKKSVERAVGADILFKEGKQT